MFWTISNRKPDQSLLKIWSFLIVLSLAFYVIGSAKLRQLAWWSNNILEDPGLFCPWALHFSLRRLLAFVLKLGCCSNKAFAHTAISQGRRGHCSSCITCFIREKNHFQKSFSPRQTFLHVFLARFVSLVHFKIDHWQGEWITKLWTQQINQDSPF